MPDITFITPDKSLIVETIKDEQGNISEQRKILKGVLREQRFYKDGKHILTVEYDAQGNSVSEVYIDLQEDELSQKKHYLADGRYMISTSFKNGEVRTERYEKDGRCDVWIEKPDGTSVNEKYAPDGTKIASVVF